MGVAGVVQINTPDTDPSRGGVELPETFEAPPLIQGCRAGKAADLGSFVYVGRGGLPPNPRDPISPQTVWHDLRTPGDRSRTETQAARKRESSQKQEPFVVVRKRVGPIKDFRQAQGWIVAPDGTVILTAKAPTVIPQSSRLNNSACQLSSQK